jgi:N-acetylated-alpha-linked acidic dipeptidase
MEKHICWLDGKEKELEKRVLAEYSQDAVRSHLEYLTVQPRRPGTETELRAANYIKGKLEEYGIDGEIYEFDAYVGQDGEAKLDILSPVQKSFPCVPRSFTAPTPPAGIEGELISLGKGLEEDYQGVDVRGKIVLISPGGLAADRMPASQRAEEKGAIAQIHIATGKTRDIHMGQIRNAWGNPTPDTMNNIPQTPLISICNEDGRQLAALTREAPVVVRLNTDAWRGYTRVRQPIGTLKGVKEPEKFVLFGGHYCSWYKGATDNAAANSLMLEMARIFAKHRKDLARSIKFAWWTCHEQGTYAGSTWFVDNFWEDVRENAVAYFVVDGLGRGDAPGFVARTIEARNSEDIRKFNEMVIKEMFGLEVKSERPKRSGDQSFWGMGLPSVFGNPVFKAEQTGAKNGGEVWYSHTVEDTIDKVDLEHMFQIPFKVTAVSILRLCNNPVLPFEFVTMAEAYGRRLNDLQQGNSGVLDLTPLITQFEAFKKRAESLNMGIEKNLVTFEGKGTDKNFEKKFKEINACLMGISQILMPLLWSKSGKYGQDAIGTDFKPIPTLQPLEKLNLLGINSNEYRAWCTSLLRERNKISDALNLANGILDRTLEKI